MNNCQEKKLMPILNMIMIVYQLYYQQNMTNAPMIVLNKIKKYTHAMLGVEPEELSAQ